MKIRKLELRDGSLMLEWMHDRSVTRFLNKRFETYGSEDVTRFIKNSRDESKDYHRAIVSDTDEYMGTVSLKEINSVKHSAELAIVVRSSAMGKGYSLFALERILDIAFDEMKLESVYWCVNKNDLRTRRFYEKHGFRVIVDIPDDIASRYKDPDNLIWYAVLAGDDYLRDALNRGSVVGCKVISIKTIPTVNAGELSFFEGDDRDVDFSIKRVYYITKVSEGVRRGFHAHKELKQILFCPYGRIQLILENEHGREEITLSDPSIGVVIDRPTWREMLWLQKDSVLCVASSDFYKVEDYIRDHDEFLEFMKHKTENK